MAERHEVVYVWSDYLRLGEVIVDGRMVYHELDLRERHPELPAEVLAKRLGWALDTPLIRLEIPVDEMEALDRKMMDEDWTFEDVRDLAMIKLEKLRERVKHAWD